MRILNTHNVTKSYDGCAVLRGVNIAVEAGEVYGLLGAKGVGKSTLLNIAAGRIADYDGEIELFGERASFAALRNIGFVQQDFVFHNNLSAMQNVMFFGRLYKPKRKELSHRSIAALKMLGLWEHRNRKPGTFSDGMKRRLNLACSIVHNPALLILDEPTANIDSQSRNYILDTIKELNRGGTTIIYAGRYGDDMDAICSHIAIMDEGRIVENGSIAQIKEKYQKNNRYECVIDGVVRSGSLFPPELVIDSTVIDNRVIVTFNRELSLVDVVMALAINRKSFVSIGRCSPSLDDIFLTITGKTLRDDR